MLILHNFFTNHPVTNYHVLHGYQSYNSVGRFNGCLKSVSRNLTSKIKIKINTQVSKERKELAKEKQKPVADCRHKSVNQTQFPKTNRAKGLERNYRDSGASKRTTLSANKNEVFDSIKRRLEGRKVLYVALWNISGKRTRRQTVSPLVPSIDYCASRGWVGEWSDFRRKYRPEGGIRFEMRKTYSTTIVGGKENDISYFSLSIFLLSLSLFLSFYRGGSSHGVTLI